MNAGRGPVLLGIDAGGTVTKVAAFDLSGRQVAVASEGTVVSSPRPRWQERDMDELWQQCALAMRKCLAAVAAAGLGPVLAVGVCGHNDGAYLVDAAGAPVRPAILATDSRAHAYADRIRGDDLLAKRALELTGQVPFAASPAAVMQWLRDEEPDALARTRWELFCKDYLRLRLTGEAASESSEASASFTDLHSQAWSDEALELYGLRAVRDLLPPLRGAAEVAGTVTTAAAEATGLPAGTPVVTGAHDVDAAAVGIGALEPGRLSLVMGTFSINQVVGTAAEVDPRWQARAFLRPGQWLHMSTSPSSASNLDWFVRRFGPYDADGRPDPAAAVELAAAVVARGGSGGAGDGPVFLPFLYGSPHGDDVAAALVGVRGWHEVGDVALAVLEGVVLNHRTHVDALRERFALREPARLCGGGSRSPWWSQLLADALDLAIEVTDADEAGARGAAVLAGVGAGVWPDLGSAVAETVHVVRRHDPDAAATARLDTAYDRYRRVVDSVRGL